MNTKTKRITRVVNSRFLQTKKLADCT